MAQAANLDKKQRGFDKTVDEWRRKHDDLNAELDASQRETRTLGTEMIKLKSANDEIVEHVSVLRSWARNPRVRQCSSKVFVVRTRISLMKLRI